MSASPLPCDSLAARMAAGVYGFLWRAARPLVHGNARLADGFSQRLVPQDWMSEPVDVWMQAASGGEARLVLAVARALADVSAQPLTLLATTWTRQGFDILEAGSRLLAEQGSTLRLIVRFVPLDEPALMERALDQAKPRLLVIFETELWPGMMLACARRNVPVLFANARMRAASARRYAWIAPMWRRLAPCGVCAMADSDAARFASIFPGVSVDVIPNIKFDLSAPAHISAELAARVAALIPADGLPTVLLASVREEEEQLLIQALAERITRGETDDIFDAPARLIVAPRHLHRSEDWLDLLAELGLSPCRRSELETSPQLCTDTTTIVWDAFGELPGLYAAADAVFVGGSLAPLGGQNFLEPLAAGRVPLVGPDTSNFAWTLDDEPSPESPLTASSAPSDGLSALGTSGNLEACGLLRRVEDADAALDALAAELTAARTTAEHEAVRSTFTTWLAPRLGGAAKTAARILQLI